GKFVLQPQNKRNLIQNVRALWRSFKSKLTRKYIMPFKDHWEEFVKIRLSKNWEEFVKIRLSKNFQ
ncbi:hypothetical protein MKW92_024576, partial [Papaver armeniacum]